MRSALLAILVATIMHASALAQGQEKLQSVIKDHPAADVLGKVFSKPAPTPAPEALKSTGMTRKDYLPLIAGNIDYWKNFQNPWGEIVDPYEGREKQYSTPAFALAAALLVQEAKRDDLLQPAARAVTRSLEDLLNRSTADLHADFYIPMLVHARRLLKDRVDAKTLAMWDEHLKAIVPEQIYRDTTAGANWNIVNVSGEYLRRKDGLVVKDQLKGQLDYLENCLATQEKKRFTKFGFYADPSSPLAYDAFPRLWLEDAVADGAVEGEWRKRLDDWLTQGALAGLLLISPSGEWPHGGRSAHHQWNEAENCAIAEINAIRWKKAGREDIAGSFKRAAHLCLTSVSRWQRPSGELWIVKNFADPARRHGFEGYSFHSQYNLLPMAMLAIAYLHADDSIPERPIPSESASYVFSFHEGFHHVAAAAGGYYVLIDTAADLHYGSTGLQRIHRAGVELSPITDTPGPSADYGPPEEHPRAAMVTGMEWKGDDGQWHSLGEFGVPPPKNPNPTQPADPGPVTEDVDVEVKDQTKDRIAFLVRYHTAGQGARTVEEHYVISKSGLEGTQRITGSAPSATRVVFPALVHDGARPTDVQIDGATVRIKRAGALTRDLTSENKDWLTKPGGSMSWTLQSPPGVELSLNGPQIVTHNGYVQAVRGELPTGTREIKWKLTLE